MSTRWISSNRSIEKFSIDRLLEIHRVDIARRLEGFRKLVAFEEELDE